MGKTRGGRRVSTTSDMEVKIDGSRTSVSCWPQPIVDADKAPVRSYGKRPCQASEERPSAGL